MSEYIKEPIGSTPELSAAAEVVMDDLVFSALARYMEALNQKEEAPGVVWLSSERMQADDRPDEHAMWFRLGADQELLPGVEWFDVGLAVQDPDAPRPLPLEQSGPDRHFYVRRWTSQDHPTGMVTVRNALEAATEEPVVTALPVRGLLRKLNRYHLHNIRVWHKGHTTEETVA